MNRPVPLTSAIATLIHARQIGCTPPDGQVPADWITRAAEDIAWALVRQLDGTEDLDRIRHHLQHTGARS